MCLVADIGGTNARFALVEVGGFIPEHQRTLLCANYHSLVDALLAYLDDVSQQMPETASLAIATPVTNDRIVMTNHVWDLSVKQTRKVLGLKSLKVLNDYTALALSLPYLGDDDYHQVGRGMTVEKQNLAVLGPGTGLGVSGAIFAGDYWTPLQGEGGHVSYGPLTDRETEVIEIIRRHHNFVSAESLVSGPGLVLLYESIAKCDGVEHELLSPQQIASRALNAIDSSAEQAVAMFCGILGSIAGNLALTLGARGGLFIGGGIVPKLGDYFTRSPFRARFENNSRFGKYLSQIPTYVISSKYPALIGAAVAVKQQYHYLGVTSASH
jgi:glucokinase